MAASAAEEEVGTREAMRKRVRRVSAVFMEWIRTCWGDESIIRPVRGETFGGIPEKGRLNGRKRGKKWKKAGRLEACVVRESLLRRVSTPPKKRELADKRDG